MRVRFKMLNVQLPLTPCTAFYSSAHTIPVSLEIQLTFHLYRVSRETAAKQSPGHCFREQVQSLALSAQAVMAVVVTGVVCLVDTLGLSPPLQVSWWPVGPWFLLLCRGWGGVLPGTWLRAQSTVVPR
jgi:hypothetical protein